MLLAMKRSRTSGGLLMFREQGDELEVLLVAIKSDIVDMMSACLR